MFESWFCLPCYADQPKYTTYEEFDDYAEGEGTFALTATLHVCEEFAKELYGADIDEPSTKYDNCAMFIYDWPEVAEGVDPAVYDDVIEVGPQILPLKPSFKFANAAEFMNSDHLKPPYWRVDNGHEILVNIVREDEK